MASAASSSSSLASSTPPEIKSGTSAECTGTMLGVEECKRYQRPDGRWQFPLRLGFDGSEEKRFFRFNLSPAVSICFTIYNDGSRLPLQLQPFTRGLEPSKLEAACRVVFEGANGDKGSICTFLTGKSYGAGGLQGFTENQFSNWLGLHRAVRCVVELYIYYDYDKSVPPSAPMALSTSPVVAEHAWECARNGTRTDVRIHSTDGVVIPAHSLVLSLSPYWQSHLSFKDKSTGDSKGAVLESREEFHSKELLEWLKMLYLGPHACTLEGMGPYESLSLLAGIRRVSDFYETTHITHVVHRKATEITTSSPGEAFDLLVHAGFKRRRDPEALVPSASASAETAATPAGTPSSSVMAPATKRARVDNKATAVGGDSSDG